MSHYSIDLFGKCEIQVDGQPVGSHLYVKTRALLAYLVIESGSLHRRSSLASLLWPNKSNTAALISLRQAVNQLRNTNPPLSHCLEITPQTIQFKAESQFQSDVSRFQHIIALTEEHAHISRSDCARCFQLLEDALEQYKGPLLAGLDVKDAPEFSDWLEIKQQAYERIALAALGDAAEYALEHERFDLAQQAALRQIKIDPYREIAHRQYMRSLAESGLRSEAVQQYNSLQKLLANELGVRPESETVLLYEQICQDEQPQLDPSSAFLPGRFSVPAGAPGLRSKPVFVGRKKELAFLQSALQETLKGRGKIVFVSGEAGWGKTALIDAFTRQAATAHPTIIPAFGKGNAYTGIGDPYLPFRDILGFLSGNVETRWTAGAISQELASRVLEMAPSVVKTIVEEGADLIEIFVPGQALIRRVSELSASENQTERGWVDQLRRLVERGSSPQPAAAPMPQKNYFDQYVSVVKKISLHTPLILVLDDLQWVDPGSISLLFHLAKSLANSRILVIGAYRPLDLGFVRSLYTPAAARPDSLELPPALPNSHQRHPLEAVINELTLDYGSIHIKLEKGEAGFIDALIDSQPNFLGNSFRAELKARTKGHPLFAVELLQNMLASGGLVKDKLGRLIEGEALDWEALPARVEALIIERLARLPQRQQNVLKTASVEGEVFTAEVIAGALGIGEDELIQLLNEEIGKEHGLVVSESIQWSPTGQRSYKFRFDHILFQKFLYGTLDPPACAYWHERIGARIESLFSQDIAENAVSLSWHFENAGQTKKAVVYLNIAGEKALRISANQEALTHFNRALELLELIPASPEKAGLELALQVNLAVSFLALKGYADANVGKALSRAYEIGKNTENVSQIFPIMWQLACYRSSQADFTGGAAMMQELIGLAEQAGDPLLLALGHWGMGWSELWAGNYLSSQRHLTITIHAYDPAKHENLAALYSQDPFATSRSILGLDLLALGYPEQGLKMVQSAVDLARRINHLHTLALTLAYGGIVSGLSGCFPQVLIAAEEVMEITLKNRFVYWYSAGLSLHGWALGHLGRAEEGMRELAQALEIIRESEAEAGREVHCISMGDICSQTGKAAEALALANRQIASSRASGGLILMPEILRTRAEALLKLRPSDEAGAEASFQESIEVARQQNARFLELKSTLSLARLWVRQGKREQARSLLAPAYSQLSEGFDLPDLQSARKLLQELEHFSGANRKQ